MGVKVAGAAFTGVKPPALTGVKPEVTVGAAGGACCGVATGASSIGMFFMLFSYSSFIEALRASEALIAGDSPRRLDGVFWYDFFKGEFAGEGVSGPPYSNSSC